MYGLPRWLSGKESAYQAGDACSISGSGRFPGEGNGNPLQYSCLKNSVDRGAWQATVHGGRKELDITERISTHRLYGTEDKAHFTFQFYHLLAA